MGRVLGFVGTVVTLAIGMYLYSQQVKTLTPGTAAAGTDEFPLIAGVKNDLISIANAERGSLASEGKYQSLDELVAGKYLSVPNARPPYTYTVETSPSGFRATATRTTKGTPAQLWITESMQVQASE